MPARHPDGLGRDPRVGLLVARGGRVGSNLQRQQAPAGAGGRGLKLKQPNGRPNGTRSWQRRPQAGQAATACRSPWASRYTWCTKRFRSQGCMPWLLQLMEGC